MAAPSGRTTPNGYPYPVDNDDVNVPRDIEALAEAIEAKAYIIGEVRHIAALALPPGWMACDGSAKSRTTYDLLFAAIGTLFGAGDGSTTFNLPDIQGRVIAGAGAAAGGGIEANPPNRIVGTKWGVNAVILSTAQMPAHNHPVTDPGHTHPMNPDYNGININAGMTNYGVAVWLGTGHTFSAATGITIQNNGGGQSHENAPPSIAIPAFIYAGE